jgi:hypothetical protein
MKLNNDVAAERTSVGRKPRQIRVQMGGEIDGACPDEASMCAWRAEPGKRERGKRERGAGIVVRNPKIEIFSSKNRKIYRFEFLKFYFSKN